MVEATFWISVFLILYPYLFYPLLIGILGLLRPRPVMRKRDYLPSITILIPAYNEADCIEATVRNKLQLDYPRDLLQIIVASDGSTDGTDEIVGRFASDGVELLRVEGRNGKAIALNEAVGSAKGELLVFSDANSLFDTAALRHIAANFADQEIGYVTGSLGFTKDAATLSGSGVDAYMRYENTLRRLESRAGSIIGVNGGVDAIRRELYSDIPKELITDFVLPLRVLASGYRVVFDPAVRAVEQANDALSSEFRMRVRVALRALQGLLHMKRLLNPLRFPLASFCLLSHKLLRYCGFLFLLTALISNLWLALSHQPFYQWLLGMHLACYVLALVGMRGSSIRSFRLLTTIPSYVLMSYAAFAVAALKFLRGQRMATWQPRAG